MRHPDGFRDSVAPLFAPSLAYPSESRPDDRYMNHPSLPLRPSPPYLTSSVGGRQRFPERAFSGTTQNRYTDPGRGEIFAIIPRGYYTDE